MPLAVLVISVLVAVLALGEGAFALVLRVRAGANKPAEPTQTDATEGKSGVVSFCAVGDNLINDEDEYAVSLLELGRTWGAATSGTQKGTKAATDDADAATDDAGEKTAATAASDDTYDFSPLYAHIQKAVSSYDLAFVNQETIFGGNEDGLEYAGFPEYNTPDAVADALAGAGFDLVNINTNHTWDLGAKAIERTQKVWEAEDGVTVLGSYASEKDRENLRVVERNGIKFAFLSYSYGQNAYDVSSLPNDYYAVPFVREQVGKEVGKAKKVADVVVVYMHWGSDYGSTITNDQAECASYLAGLGVDLVIGSHAQVIQPVRYVSRGLRTTSESDGGATENDSQDKMLCVYGLGNLASGHTLSIAVLSGMFSCDFVRDSEGAVHIENPVWHGMVEHNDGVEDSVYLLSDYTSGQAQNNLLMTDAGNNDDFEVKDALDWAQQKTREVIGEVIEVDV